MGYTKQKLSAIFFAVLMATSMIAMPALATGLGAHTVNERSTGFSVQAGGPPGHGNGPPGQNGGGPPGHDRGDGNVTVPELESNTSVETVLNATERLDELEIEGDTSSTAVNDTVKAVNASLREYRQLEYADSRAAFDHLADAHRSLAELRDTVDEEDREIVDEISHKLYVASDRSARLTVVDSQTIVAANDGEFRNPGQRQKAESALGNAIDALERADRTVSTDATPTSGPSPQGNQQGVGPAERASAMTHLENAWKHAERALDTVERNTDPTLSLSEGQAFERNDTILVPLSAALEDVRPYAYDEAMVTVDGDAKANDFSLIAGESSGTTAHGTTLLDLGSDPANVTVTVTATSTRDADRTVQATQEIRVDEDDVLWDRPDPSEYRKVDVSNDSSGVAVEVRGDGLHETDVSITDETPATDDAFRAGPMVRIESQQEFDEATVEIPIDETALDREGNLSIVTWDPGSEEPWTAVETEIDREAGVATAEVDHFSFFSLFWIDDWEDATSDTITLDGNETDGGDGNGSGIEKADFVFVIDESGSMSGSPIAYAEEATERFVGALTDDERAALVGYDSGAGLEQSLTADHDALNSSLGNLYASGGTDTEAGLRTGLNHLESNGWENRSEVMILLSDGNSNSGSYPRRVAEDAAAAGVEISTIGLGNSIDENELRDIAAITGGDFHHVEREEDLPETFERVAENQTGVDLQDTNGDGIPDLVAEMDLSMPTGEPGVVGEPLNLDPIALDTSGDGIRDNETVDINYRVYEENNETKLTAQVTYAQHHPARVDTTGDGLTDAEQQREGWEIAYTNSREDSLEVLSELEDAADLSDLDDVDDVFETTRVHANPLLNDTNGDGLSDLEEVEELGTDPEAIDTTGDGIPDADAADPTLFDVSSPELTVTYAEFDDPSASVSVSIGWDGVDVDTELDTTGTYEAQFIAEDPAGLDEARLLQDGNIQDRTSLSGTRDDGNLSFETGTLSTFADLFTGTTVTVEVDDRHETVEGVGTAEAEAIDVGGIFNEVSKELRAAGLSSSEIELALGFLEGTTTGAGETLGGILAIYDDPWVLVEAAQAIPEAVANFDEIIAALPEQIESQQEQNNPHDEGDRYHDEFRYGWYQGYFFWFVVEAAIPAGEAGKALKSTDTVQSTVNKISTPQIRRAAQIAKQGGQTATAPVRYSRQQFVRGLSTSIGVTRETGQRLLSSVSTSGQQLKVTKAIDRNDIDGSRINRFGGKEAEAAGRLTARHGDSGAKLLRGEICNSPCKSVFESVNEYRGDGLSNTQAKQLLQAYTKADDADVGPGSRKSADEVQSTIEELDDANVQNVRGTMASVSKSKSGFRQIAGEVEVADRIRRDENIDGQDILMQQKSSGIDNAPNSKTEIDVKIEGEVSIGGETYQSPAIESKHWNPEKWPPEEINVDPSWDSQLSDLTDKLVTQAVDGEDTLIVVLPEQTIVEHGSKFDEVIENTKRDLEANSEVTADEVQITYTSYKEIGE